MMEKDLVDILHRCFRCGWCKFPTNYQDLNCPAYLRYRFESFSAGGRMWLIRAWLNKEIKTSERLSQILFSCATCKNCVEACAIPQIKDSLVDIFIAARQDMVEDGIIPPPARDYLKAMSISGNPYKRPREERGKWAEGLDIPRYTDQEYLFYVGDEGCFDDLGIRMTRSIARLLLTSGVSFGILGADEQSDGNETHALGETGLFTEIARQNIEAWNRIGVRKIITISPHAYHALRNEYPKYGPGFLVYHYTQVLSTVVQQHPVKRESSARVTYHDSCYLGRWNRIYLEPRAILNSIKGLTLIEMDRSMQNALCCGGGGGNFFTDILGTGSDLSSRARIREALTTGADIIAVSCPQCFRMLDDAVKAQDAQEKIRVMEISEIMNAALT
jgi:Fe-S oxidoreductase